MKMPWSFLARRRTTDPSPTEIAEVKEAFETVDVPPDPVEQRPAALQGVVDDALTTTVEDAPEPSGAAESVDDEGSSIELPMRQTSVSQTKSSPQRGVSTRRKQHGRVGALPANPSSHFSKGESRNTQSSVSEPRATDGSHSSVSALDGEINRLRRQLADKLRLQNDQLKQLLRRFDPS